MKNRIICWIQGKALKHYPKRGIWWFIAMWIIRQPLKVAENDIQSVYINPRLKVPKTRKTNN